MLLKIYLLLLMNIRSYNVIVAPYFANIAVERFAALYQEKEPVRLTLP
jgi:hypothetical protein